MLAYLMLFAALTNSVCLNNASFFSLFYERAMSSPEKKHLKITTIIIIIIISILKLGRTSVSYAIDFTFCELGLWFHLVNQTFC